MSFDLIIRGGRVIDGTGLLGYRADVAVKDGRIAKVGRIEESGAREFDADGLVAVDYPTNTTPGADWLPRPPKPPKGSPGWKLKPKGWVPKPPRPPKLPWWRPSFRFGSPQVGAAVVTGAAGLATGCAIAHIKVKKKRIREHIGDFLLKVCPSCWNW